MGVDPRSVTRLLVFDDVPVLPPVVVDTTQWHRKINGLSLGNHSAARLSSASGTGAQQAGNSQKQHGHLRLISQPIFQLTATKVLC
jgi:hypothetical protein